MAIKSVTLYTVTVVTKQGTSFTATDSAQTGMFGTVALHNVKEHETVEIGGGQNGIVYIPWHNVGNVTVAKSTSTETVTDANCEPSNS